MDGFAIDQAYYTPPNLGVYPSFDLSEGQWLRYDTHKGDDPKLIGRHLPYKEQFNRLMLVKCAKFIQQTRDLGPHAECVHNLHGGGLGILFGCSHPLLVNCPVEPFVARKSYRRLVEHDDAKYFVPWRADETDQFLRPKKQIRALLQQM
jgi:hypothetical protein